MCLKVFWDRPLRSQCCTQDSQDSLVLFRMLLILLTLLVGLQGVSSIIGDPCSTPADCSGPEEDCVTSTNVCACSADYYQTIYYDCQMMPRDVTNVTATSTRNSTTGVVSLTVKWTPGNYTGPTNYLIILEEETSLGSDNFMKISSVTVAGYNITEWTKIDVLAYWNYRVYVLTATVVGSSSFVGPSIVRTNTSTPGVVHSVVANQDDTVAQEMSLTIVCPAERERNGVITGYVIRKRLLDETGVVIKENEYVVDADTLSSCTQSYTASDVGGIVVGKNYTFAVKTNNTDFSGSYSSEVSLSVEPRAPLFSEELLTSYGVTALIRKPEIWKHLDGAIVVVVCASCLLDDRQGRVERLGLIVCKVGQDGQCQHQVPSKLNVSQFDQFTTWGQASQSEFVPAFRATSDTWMLSTNNTGNNNSYPFKIGSNKSCSLLPDTTYCDGPLPEDSEFRVAAIQCNAVDCLLGPFEGPIRTAHNPDDIGLKVGLAVAGSLVVIVIIVVIIGVLRILKS